MYESTSFSASTHSTASRAAATSPVLPAIERLVSGGLVIIRDDEGRENEGDLVAAASLATPEVLNRMVTDARGLVCQPVSRTIAERLALHPQAPMNTDRHGTAFTVSVDAATGVSTGISAADRARTARIVADPASRPQDLRRPGHMFPLVARDGGVFERTGHTEASVDLMRLAGLPASALICEIMAADGSMARGEELERLATAWDIPLISVTEIIAYRRAIGDLSVRESSRAELPTAFGTFHVTAFTSDDPAAPEALLLEAGSHGRARDASGTFPLSDAPAESATSADGIDAPETFDAPTASDSASPPPLVRVHSECLTGDALASARCDCGPQLHRAMELVARQGGAIVYLRQEGRGIGLFEKVNAYALQDQGLDTVDANLALGHGADERDYGVAAAVLRSRGYLRVRLLTNNPEKVQGLEAGGIGVAERVPILVGETTENRRYMETKVQRMGHLMRRTAAAV